MARSRRSNCPWGRRVERFEVFDMASSCQSRVAVVGRGTGDARRSAAEGSSRQRCRSSPRRGEVGGCVAPGGVDIWREAPEVRK